MRLNKYISLAYLLSIANCYVSAVTGQTSSTIPNDSTFVRQKEILYYKHQRDLVDIALLVIRKDPNIRVDRTDLINRKLQLSAAPILEYSLSTGFASGLAAIGAFSTSDQGQTRTSSFVLEVKYTEKKQFLFPIGSSIWTRDNKYNFLGDWRFLNYPQDTYGIGGSTTMADGYVITYKYIRMYEFALKKIRNNIYMGLGYQFDYHWGITELNVPPGRVTDFKRYGYSNTATSSGFALDILYDSRKSSMNPEGGSFFANLELMQKSTEFGSNSNWNSILIDIRKYVRLPHNNVLAFWSYNVFTLSGNPPYLDLPSTGSDTYNNTGRGYEQGRFIGKRMVDLEAEFRYGITHNGLLGGVVFANAESLSEFNTNKFQVISPAVGVGLRIKFNKFSNTNLCIDYGVGANGSHGFFGNLGEVF